MPARQQSWGRRRWAGFAKGRIEVEGAVRFIGEYCDVRQVVDVVLDGIGGFRLGFVDPMFPGLALLYSALIRVVGISLRSTVTARDDGQVATPVGRVRQRLR
jgi:hypothetical protein